MTDLFDAHTMSPVPVPGPDAVAPQPFHGIYGMPAFLTVPTPDLVGSEQFWTRGLGFFSLFAIPGRLVHLRRWAFQDVLLVPAVEATTPSAAPAMGIGFACVESELDPLVAACRELGAPHVGDPRDTPWNTRDVEVITPEAVRIVFTAGKVLEPGSRQARDLAAVGIVAPGDISGRDDS